jgi:hypothetical protein
MSAELVSPRVTAPVVGPVIALSIIVASAADVPSFGELTDTRGCPPMIL